MNLGLSFAEGEGGGEGEKGGKGEENKGGDVVPKADFESAKADLDKAKADLEDMRMEVLTPEYLDFLNVEKGEKKEEPKKDDGIKDDDLEKLTKKEILALADKKAEEKLLAFQNEIKSGRAADTKQQVAAFARTHTDYSTYRPIMYGMSLDPKHANANLDELYTLAKEHVKGIHTETSEAEKEKQRKMVNDKPGGASESFEELKKLDSASATKKAAEEVAAKLGAIPDA